MIKVVYNACHGGFGLSKKALTLLGLDDEWSARELKRHDPDLVYVVETLGSEAASGKYADLQIEVVEDLYWIDEYDGAETVWTPDTIPWVNAKHDLMTFPEKDRLHKPRITLVD